MTGVRGTLAAFRKLPKDATVELRNANQSIADELDDKIAVAARASSRQSEVVASGIKARRDRVPSVQAGGSRKVASNRRPLHKLLFGANFGAKFLPQFRPHRGSGTKDYWFYSTVDDNRENIAKQWTDAADRVLREWGSGE
ncbi:hypothetical protein [Kribbella sp. NPDC051770]|uniref:hypothetical protein n=1 Tax=Kribbella sp. NPDC051770 TaxID=3155413 RepID=UPI003430284B